MQWSIRKAGSIPFRPLRRLAADATFRSPGRRTSSQIPTRWAKAARYAMPPARSSPLTRNTRSNVPHSAMTQWHVVLLGLSLAAAGAAQTLPAGYVGSETCNVCHEDIYNGIAKSPHHAVDTDLKRGWQGRVCESCHGPGQKHAESGDASLIRNPANLTAAATDRICLTCHLNQPTQVGRLESSHARNQVACITCHKVHESKSLVVRKAEAT